MNQGVNETLHQAFIDNWHERGDDPCHFTRADIWSLRVIRQRQKQIDEGIANPAISDGLLYESFPADEEVLSRYGFRLVTDERYGYFATFIDPIETTEDQTT